MVPGGGGGGARSWLGCPPPLFPAWSFPPPGPMGLGASVATAVLVWGSPLRPPAPPPPLGAPGCARLVGGWSRIPVALRLCSQICTWARGAGEQGWGQVLPLGWVRPAREARQPPTTWYRGCQLRSQKLGLDKPEQTCYYVHARLVSALRGPAFWQSVTLGKKIVRKGGLFFALPGGSMNAIFHASLSALPGRKPSRRRASHPQLDKPENCQLRLAIWRGRLLDHVT